MSINHEAIIQTQNLVFQATQKIIDQMELNARKTTKDFVNPIAVETDTPIAITNGLVSLYLLNSSEIKSRSGAFGGHFKIASNKEESKPSLSSEE